MTSPGSSHRRHILLVACGNEYASKFDTLTLCFLDWAEVKAVATDNALQFLDKSTFPSSVDILTTEDDWFQWVMLGDDILHLELCKWADAVVIAPSSANTLGKIAKGLCDNLLTSVVRAWDYNKPLFVLPSMSISQWNNGFTQSHLDTLQRLRVKVIPPIHDLTDCTSAALNEPSAISDFVKNFLENQAPDA
ncbi:hypothetical protein AMTRI_Chr11g154700 [Amborella trichopoda]|uniref:phosphopantothenoylcysteine decarboxylase n=1 Tax=Amborella trichopoda TaxID=13333 RepID=U5DJ67_AMBTC|nr:phosphopantothenoylcysteine decarboxylase [Amborella trichopoda]XP_011628871.1 phosphopantothenoylcysteine decarboxylase [Amborella trichopoda]ERN20648.1 hypothetical protein AMTR_s00070p00153810 [Amborella trichopoda]|eukprot:XP_006859181.1 phosphopantothenoylcysteine decarboxylase [Amborella trichopoda]